MNDERRELMLQFALAVLWVGAIFFGVFSLWAYSLQTCKPNDFLPTGTLLVEIKSDASSDELESLASRVGASRLFLGAPDGAQDSDEQLYNFVFDSEAAAEEHIQELLDHDAIVKVASNACTYAD